MNIEHVLYAVAVLVFAILGAKELLNERRWRGQQQLKELTIKEAKRRMESDDWEIREQGLKLLELAFNDDPIFQAHLREMREREEKLRNH